MKKRTMVYVDGFNLYYGLLRQDPAYKWLDLWKFSRSLVSPENDIVGIQYFTSRVNYDFGSSRVKAVDRMQMLYA